MFYQFHQHKNQVERSGRSPREGDSCQLRQGEEGEDRHILGPIDPHRELSSGRDYGEKAARGRGHIHADSLACIRDRSSGGYASTDARWGSVDLLSQGGRHVPGDEAGAP